jgi:hypothetical protein
VVTYILQQCPDPDIYSHSTVLSIPVNALTPRFFPSPSTQYEPPNRQAWPRGSTGHSPRVWIHGTGKLLLRLARAPRRTYHSLRFSEQSCFYGPPKPDQERFAVLDKVYEVGCRFWDTADCYMDSEDLLGERR